jgi:osmotically inducible protein OsmC
MPTRKAHARWEGSLKEGKGQVDFGNGLFKGPYSFASRFEDGKGTNPEELLGAAHASCFAMALSLMLGNAAKVPGIEEASFRQHAAAAKAGCPVSQALAGTEITLEARLVA